MGIKRHIPNLITLLNLLCGCIAVVFASRSDFEMTFYFVCGGIFLDFFDGFFARMFKVASPLGLQLDSLADMVTSGVTPGFVMFLMMSNNNSVASWFPYLGFLITLGSCYRLANFNIDTRQTDSFIGLPTPANTLFILSLPLVLMHTDSLMLLELLVNPWVLLTISIFSAFILNAEIPLFSLKVKKMAFKGNELPILFLLYSIVVIVIFTYSALPLIILSYILLSVVNNKLLKK